MPTTEETAAQLEAARKALEDAQKAHADAIANAPPRSFEEIMLALIAYLSMKFGHHVEIAALLTEMDKRVKLDRAPEAKPANTAGV